MKRTPRFQRTPPLGAALALVIAAFLACDDNDKEDDDQFREDVIWCEEAAAHLSECCPKLDVTALGCRFYYSRHEGCGSVTTTSTEPAFTKDESKCMRDTSCSVLVSSGVCERAADAGAARTTTTTTTTSSSSGSGSGSGSTQTSAPPLRDPVCP